MRIIQLSPGIGFVSLRRLSPKKGEVMFRKQALENAFQEMKGLDLDPFVKKWLGTIPSSRENAQYSTEDQILVLLECARKLGLQDAYDAIKNRLK